MTAADLPGVMSCAASIEHVPQYAPAVWVEMLAAQGARVALVAAGTAGEIYGFAVAGRFGPQAELELIAVAPASQRQGIGRQLLAAITGELRAAEARQIWLEVRESNQAAIALYRAAGFRETGRRPRYYADPVEDGLLMDLDLF